jgi:23S rRNA pseudouridine1911/1915/1917 synthase
MPDQHHESFVSRVDSDNAGKRLDAFVTSLFPDLSRTAISRLIRHGKITVNHSSIAKPGVRLALGDMVSGSVPTLSPSPPLMPEKINLSILFEDAAILVINKPPGIVVHPSPGHTHGTLAGGLLHHHPAIAGVGGFPGRPGIVHRLDKDTSGVLVIAKTEKAYIDLIRQFKERLVTKTYMGLVYGNMDHDRGQIVLPIGRHAENRKKMGVSNSTSARFAETHWKLFKGFNGISLVEFDLKTGRTHQIRVHCAAIRHPIVGDTVYGLKKPGRLFDGRPPRLKKLVEAVPRQMLHAWLLEIHHPETGQRMKFEAGLPEDMNSVIESLQEWEGV